MRPELRRFGEHQSPVVLVDNATGDPGATTALAAALAPFPPAQGSYYPGLRRFLTDQDTAAMDYVHTLLENLSPFIGGGFDVERFDLVEASFSMVTTPPAALTPPQRAPHFDSTDPLYLAVLHYLSDTPGTAFYRQRATGIERVDDANKERFIAAARRESDALSGYIAGSNAAFEQIGKVEGLADRAVIYSGCLLHSGLITPGLPLDADPCTGRLTCNIFVKGHRG
jgi:hypothetical protein